MDPTTIEGRAALALAQQSATEAITRSTAETSRPVPLSRAKAKAAASKVTAPKAAASPKFAPPLGAGTYPIAGIGKLVPGALSVDLCGFPHLLLAKQWQAAVRCRKIEAAREDAWAGFYDAEAAEAWFYGALGDDYKARLDAPLLGSMQSTKDLCRSGVPHGIRGRVWYRLSGAEAREEEAPEAYYESLVAQLRLQGDIDADDSASKRAFVRAIRADVARLGMPFKAHALFTTDAGNAMLVRVLAAFASHNPRVGYSQALMPLAALLLTVLHGPFGIGFEGDDGFDTATASAAAERRVFFLLGAIVEDVLPPGMHGGQLIGAQVELGVLDSLIASRLRKLHAHLCAPKAFPTALTCHIFAAEWFLGCFAGVLPAETTCRVIDTLVSEGAKVLHRFSLAVLSDLEHTLLSCKDASSALAALRAGTAAMHDREALVRRAFNGRVCWNLSGAQLEAMRAKHKLGPAAATYLNFTPTDVEMAVRVGAAPPSAAALAETGVQLKPGALYGDISEGDETDEELLALGKLPAGVLQGTEDGQAAQGQGSPEDAQSSESGSSGEEAELALLAPGDEPERPDPPALQALIRANEWRMDEESDEEDYSGALVVYTGKGLVPMEVDLPLAEVGADVSNPEPAKDADPDVLAALERRAERRQKRREARANPKRRRRLARQRAGEPIEIKLQEEGEGDDEASDALTDVSEDERRQRRYRRRLERGDASDSDEDRRQRRRRARALRRREQRLMLEAVREPVRRPLCSRSELLRRKVRIPWHLLPHAPRRPPRCTNTPIPGSGMGALLSSHASRSSRPPARRSILQSWIYLHQTVQCALV